MAEAFIKNMVKDSMNVAGKGYIVEMARLLARAGPRIIDLARLGLADLADVFPGELLAPYLPDARRSVELAKAHCRLPSGTPHTEPPAACPGPT